MSKNWSEWWLDKRRLWVRSISFLGFLTASTTIILYGLTLRQSDANFTSWCCGHKYGFCQSSMVCYPSVQYSVISCISFLAVILSKSLHSIADIWWRMWIVTWSPSFKYRRTHLFPGKPEPQFFFLCSSHSRGIVKLLQGKIGLIPV